MTIPVFYSSEEKLNYPVETIASAIEKTLLEFGWKHERSNGAFKGHIRMSLWSWGENFTITLSQDGTVQMKSVCSFPLTIVSWGKNKRNVNRFFAAIKKALLQ